VGRASGQWSVQFTRRFLDHNGAFAGVIVSSLDPYHLTKFYDQIDLGSSASISLIGSDGVVRASGGSAGGFPLGQDLAGSRLVERIQVGEHSTFEQADLNTGDARLVTVHSVRGQPLWVAVSARKSDIFKSSWGTLRLIVPAGSLLTLIILAAMEKILRVEAKARQKAEQLQLTLEHMSQGIMGDDRLAAARNLDRSGRHCIGHEVAASIVHKRGPDQAHAHAVRLGRDRVVMSEKCCEILLAEEVALWSWYGAEPPRRRRIKSLKAHVLARARDRLAERQPIACRQWTPLPTTESAAHAG
jgi:hypothetical protein